MPKIQPLSDQNFVKSQYRDASNLNARIRLHQQFSANPYGWQRWLFDQIQLSPGSQVLELGCGPGNLWAENAERIPDGMQVILSDFSAGMVEQARANLRDCPPGFDFRVINAEAIPLAGESFDVVIANHMLYHVPNMEQALREIQRVVKAGGRVIASTVGNQHLREIGELVQRFDVRLAGWGKLHSESFSLENGASVLGKYFAEVSLARYPDGLVVTDADLLADYILSGRLDLPAEQREGFRAFVAQEVQQAGGSFFVTKDSGVFQAKGMKTPY